MTLADSAGGICAFFNLPDGAAGSATIVVETEVRHSDHLVAKVTQTQTVRRAT